MKGHEAMFYLPMIVSLGIVFFLPLTNRKFRARLSRDPVEGYMFGVAVMLGLALLFCAAMVILTHNIEIIKIPMLATGVLALAGIVIGLIRYRRGKHSA